MAQATLSKEFQNSIEQSGKHKMMIFRNSVTKKGMKAVSVSPAARMFSSLI